MKNTTLYIKGMHCKACEVIINEKAEEVAGVLEAKSSNSSGELIIKTRDRGDVKDILDELNSKISEIGYSASLDKAEVAKSYKTLFMPFVLALTIFSIFIFLQKSGLLNLYNPNNISFTAVFVIGVIASLSSCMAVVGGLVLSLSATFAKDSKRKSFMPLTLFHISRVVSFFILGGVIGLLGSVFKISPAGNIFLTLALFFVMFVLGVNMLDIFPFFKKLQLSFPHKKVNTKVTNPIIAPMLLGALTFILPCGFTQSMQFYALSSGSFSTGALTMLVFSLGTFPVLSALSFASVKFSQGKNAGNFFKTMGFLVLFFALINLISALSLGGIIDPVLGF